MAYYMLFNIPKNLHKEELLENLCKFGSIRYFLLKDDTKNNSMQFGQIDFISLDNKDGLIDYLKSKKIELSNEKPSKNSKNNSICNNKIKRKSSKETIISNPSFHYYKDEKYGKNIEKFKFEKNNFEDIFTIKDAESFELTTVYPGLLIGSGYNHPKLKDNNDDFQLGFFFDHTTGLPIISGSSIKGLLKSIFENQEIMKDFYNETIDNNKIKDIFENRVVFYDAFIVNTKHEQKYIFGDDYITSHFSDDKMGIFKEPNPVKFLKILPEVTFKFQFKAEKELVDIFEKILLDFGIGAKTNVGYGQFVKL